AMAAGEVWADELATVGAVFSARRWRRGVGWGTDSSRRLGAWRDSRRPVSADLSRVVADLRAGATAASVSVAASSPKFWEGGAALGRGDVRVADAREWAAPGRAVSPAAADDVDVVGPADSVSAEPVCAAATPAQISSAAPIP